MPLSPSQKFWKRAGALSIQSAAKMGTPGIANLLIGTSQAHSSRDPQLRQIEPKML